MSARVITSGLQAPEMFAVGDVVTVCGGRRRYGIVESIRVAPGKIGIVVKWGIFSLSGKGAKYMKRVPTPVGADPIEFAYNPKRRPDVFSLREDGRWLRRKDDDGCGLLVMWHREGKWAPQHEWHRF